MSIFFRILLLALICLAPMTGQAVEARIYEVRVGKQGDMTRLVIEASGSGKITIVEGTATQITLPVFSFSGRQPVLKPVHNVRFIDIDGRTGHINLDFSVPMRLAQRLSLPSNDNPGAQRYVFDFIPVDVPAIYAPVAKPKTAPEPVRTVQPVAMKLEKSKTLTTQPVSMYSGIEDVETGKTPLKPMVIVLDAGHGGKDPGALAGDGTREKDITLATARAVRTQLQGRGYKVHLTRDSDIFIPLRERVNIARRYKADLFISIHADSVASGRSTAKGASVYTLSNVASDKETAGLAARENQADIIGGIDLSHEDKDVANILIDLAMRDTMNQSKKLANTLVGNFGQNNLSMRNPAHRFAGFAVLKAADVPSILLEIGYLSNPSEARELASGKRQSQLAEALSDTVDEYAQRYRPKN